MSALQRRNSAPQLSAAAVVARARLTVHRIQQRWFHFHRQLSGGQHLSQIPYNSVSFACRCSCWLVCVLPPSRRAQVELRSALPPRHAVVNLTALPQSIFANWAVVMAGGSLRLAFVDFVSSRCEYRYSACLCTACPAMRCAACMLTGMSWPLVFSATSEGAAAVIESAGFLHVSDAIFAYNSGELGAVRVTKTDGDS